MTDDMQGLIERLRGSARAIREANWKPPSAIALRVIQHALSTAYADGERYGREASAKVCDEIAADWERRAKDKVREHEAALCLEIAQSHRLNATAIRAAGEQSHG